MPSRWYPRLVAATAFVAAALRVRDLEVESTPSALLSLALAIVFVFGGITILEMEDDE